MTNPGLRPVTGSHGPYLWLATEQFDLHGLLQLCPQVVVGKYIAITSQDSGPLILTEEEKQSGWQSKNEIANSPQILSAEELRHGECGGFDEWYTFKSPVNLGQISHCDVFDSPTTSGQISSFVNYCGFALHRPEVGALVSLFWDQLDLIQPESYLADGDVCLTFVSCNKDLFHAVHHALSESAHST